ncbi:MAG TPA: M23 family metallopeptidase [Pyrinomonadaceae bacterium]
MPSNASRTRILILLVFTATVLALALLIWKRSYRSGQAQEAAPVSSITDLRPVPSSTETPAPSPTPPTPSPVTTPSTQPSPAAMPSPSVGTQALIIPVAGIRPEQLQDTFSASRSEGRTHDAIDIIAPRSAPVLAAADGKIVKLFLSKPGGMTIYQSSADNKMIYYYAHLERYADGLTEGHYARQGEVIGYVGDTGNAGPGNYHLHFSVMLVKDPARYWEGVNINPYPLLRGGGQ